MKNLSFLIVFGLIVSFAHTAEAQTHIVLPDGMTGGCLSRFNELYTDGVLTADEAADLTAACMDADIGSMNFWENLYDQFNGEGGRPTFHNMGEVMAAMTTCRFVEACPHDPPAHTDGTTRTPPPPHRTRSLLVECRGACVNDPARGIDHGITGSGFRRHVVCEEGTVPLAVEWHHSTVDGEPLRHVGDGVALFITYCLREGNPEAPGIVQTIVNETDLTDVWNHIHRLENACGPEGMRHHSADWDLLCTRFDEVVIHTTRITQLSTDLALLSTDLDALRLREDRRWARACHRSDAEWDAMTEDQHLAIIGTPQCDAVGSGTASAGWHLRFHLGAGFYLPIISGPQFVLASPNGIVYGELEALPDTHAGFFLRGFIGAGDLLDRTGQLNPHGSIGAEGVFGGSAGFVYRFDEHFALDLGLASAAGFNPGGQIGGTLHTWPWFQIGGEVRLRWNPIPLVHVELTGGLADTHTEVLFQGADHMVGSDAVGGNVTLGIGVSF